MNNRYSIQADMHCHTIASSHAYGTMSENLAEAAIKGLKALAFTDHGPNLPGAPHPWYFYNMRVLPKELNGITIIRGVEANILDVEGNIDIDDFHGKYLDWVIASFHGSTFMPKTKAIHTQALINAINSGKVDLLGHLDAVEYDFDIKEVVTESKRNNVLIEMNNSSSFVRKGSCEVCRRIALECMKQEAQVVLTSDAHCPWDIGEISTVSAILESVDFPVELVLNRDENLIYEYIDRKKSSKTENKV